MKAIELISDSGDHIFPLVLFLFGLLEAPSSSFYFFDSLNQVGKNLPQKNLIVCAFSYYFLCRFPFDTITPRVLRTKIHWLSQIAAGSCCWGTWRTWRAFLVQFGTEPTILLVFAISIACLDGILTLLTLHGSYLGDLSFSWRKECSLQTQVVRRLVCAGVLRMNVRKRNN